MISPLSEDVVLTPAERLRTAGWIRSLQMDSGMIPWEPGRHADPWNHVEAAMGLDSAGDQGSSEAAYAWLQRTQRHDGSWAAGYRGAEVSDAMTDLNFCAYLATGVRHHFLQTGDNRFLEGMWPVVSRAIDFTLLQQQPDGSINWAIDAAGTPWRAPLLASCSSIYLSLRSAIELAAVIGEPRPSWRSALVRLGGAIRDRRTPFVPKGRYAMDWYYPVLSGALVGAAAQARLEKCWEVFVVDGAGIKCVADRPWVTVAETCELVIALATIGWLAEAARLFEWTRELRRESGAYWTGMTVPDRLPWPDERTSWTAGAVLLASAALEGDLAVGRLFQRPDSAEDP